MNLRGMHVFCVGLKRQYLHYSKPKVMIDEILNIAFLEQRDSQRIPY